MRAMRQLIQQSDKLLINKDNLAKTDTRIASVYMSVSQIVV